ncbi:MAG: 2Fe-2S iron-sulfur cluster-binding protein [Rhizomicrobium sp.]
MKIVVTDRNGETREIEGRAGRTMMEILRDAGLPIAAECGGGCSCATCHVYVTDGWYEKLAAPSDAEASLLDVSPAVASISRLSCQIGWVDELDGIRLTIAPA